MQWRTCSCKLANWWAIPCRLTVKNKILTIHHTCGRVRSSTLNATCDPNIDLQFATASSLVKLGNRNLLCSEAMANSLKWRTVRFSFKLIRSYYRTFWLASLFWRHIYCVTNIARFEVFTFSTFACPEAREELARDYEFRAWGQMLS